MRIMMTIALTGLMTLTTACTPGSDAVAAAPEAKAPAAEAAAPTEAAAADQKKTTEQKKAAATKAAPKGPHPALLDPSKASATAPATYKVEFSTTKGNFVIEVTRAWAPNGADRFYNLVQIGYFDDIAFFRNIAGFMVQFGIHGNGKVNQVWKEAKISDDPVVETNAAGMVTFATAGPNTRTTQLFVNHGNNRRLDGMGFSPFGKIVSGLDVVNSLYSGYGEGAPRGRGPAQGRMQSEGNTYLRADFPEMDYTTGARILP
jgi:peptidyl-prolyl cis-trans isomerase A (cyclophilin A)